MVGAAGGSARGERRADAVGDLGDDGVKGHGGRLLLRRVGGVLAKTVSANNPFQRAATSHAGTLSLLRRIRLWERDEHVRPPA